MDIMKDATLYVNGIRIEATDEALTNGIEDLFHDMEVGQLLTIPNKLDIYNFYKQYSLR